MHYSAAQRNCILHCSVNQNRYLNSNSNNNNNNKQHCRCTVGWKLFSILKIVRCSLWKDEKYCLLYSLPQSCGEEKRSGERLGVNWILNMVMSAGRWIEICDLVLIGFSTCTRFFFESSNHMRWFDGAEFFIEKYLNIWYKYINTPISAVYSYFAGDISNSGWSPSCAALSKNFTDEWIIQIARIGVWKLLP